MSAYCQPLRPCEWHDSEPDSQWRKAQVPPGRVELLLVRRANTETTEKLGAQLLAKRFMEHAERWDRETQHLSSPAQILMHPSYDAILGMANGNEVEIIRLMLRDLREHRRLWFWALSYLTKENPIKPSDAGKLDRMINAWVDWGKQEGMLEK